MKSCCYSGNNTSKNKGNFNTAQHLLQNNQNADLTLLHSHDDLYISHNALCLVREFKYIDGRSFRGQESEAFSALKNCIAFFGVSDTENIARKNPVEMIM